MDVLKSYEKETLQEVQIDEVLLHKTELNEEGDESWISLK